MSAPGPESLGAAADNSLFLLILQHPQERHEPRATAAATVAALSRARLVAGLSWPNLGRALGRPADPRQWGVLYLGSAHAGAFDPAREFVLLGRDGKPVADPAPLLRGLQGLVLLDGTWSQAKTLWWRNPWLLKLHRMVLNPRLPSRLGKLRREPRRDALSTIEAAALILRHLEPRAEPAAALTASFDRLLAGLRRQPAPQPEESA